MMPTRSRLCLEKLTPTPQDAAMRGKIVLPNTMPSKIATVSAPMPWACIHASRFRNMALDASAAQSAKPGSRCNQENWRCSSGMEVAMPRLLIFSLAGWMADPNEGECKAKQSNHKTN